jgi:hypothetical protein
MDDRNAELGAIASDAGLERAAFLNDSARQLDAFLRRQADRVKEVGGLVLIDDDPDYLSIAPDSTFRSRTRYQDEKTGEWVSETEVIESPSELVELYNPADVYAAFAEAARVAAGFAPEPTAAEELTESAGLAPIERIGVPQDPYAEAAEDWAATQAAEAEDEPRDPDEAASRLYDLALSFQERSQGQESRILEQFEAAAERLSRHLGDLLIVDDDDERLTLTGAGHLRAEVVPEDEEGRWRTLESSEDLVQFYDPTDVFGDIAEAVAEAYPDAVHEEGGDEETEGSDDDDEDDEGDEDGAADGSDDEEDGEDEDGDAHS